MEFICVECEKIQELINDPNNDNWETVPNVCTECGGKITIKVD